MNRIARLTGIALIAVVALTASGCARTELGIFYPPSDGSQVDTANIALRNVLIVTDGEGDNAVVGAVVNKASSDDTLLELSAVQNGQVIPLVSGELEIPADGAIFFGSSDTPAVAIQGQLVAGGYVDLIFRLENAGDVEIAALVVPNKFEYADVLDNVATQAPTQAP